MTKEERRNYFFSDEVSIRERMFVTDIFFTCAILFITCIEIIIVSQSIRDVLIQLGLILVLITVCVLSVKFKKIGAGCFIFCAIMSFGYFPIVFIMSGGLYGDGPLWFIFNTVLISMLLFGKVRTVFYVIETISATACYAISYFKPEMIVQNNNFAAHTFSYVGLFAISIAVGMLLTMEYKLFMLEREKSQKQMKEIENLNASQNQFFSSMSHEIRTPINTIIGLNEMILRENISEEVTEDAVNIRSAGKLLLNLINDILDMSKFQSGKMRLMIAPYSIGNMLSDIVGMLWIRAKEKKLEFHIDVSPDIPAELVGDDVRIKQVLINILNNAIKYTNEGSVSLSVQCEHKDNNNCNMIFTITDTGIGIKSEDIPYLFTAFKRVDEHSTHHIEGTGLGLSIVKQFVDLMGGKVTVNSVYTKGSTFIVEIPQGVNNPAPVGEFNFEAKHALDKVSDYLPKFEAPDARILVVDDNESNLLVVTKLLRDTKVKIDTVTSGAMALNRTLNVRYNVILMDHLMPEMDGVECRRRIKGQTGGRCRDIPIVILTANADEQNRELYAKEGFDGYLVKPVSGNELENVIYRLLPSDIVRITGNANEIAEDTISWMKGSTKRKMVAITTESVADLPKEIAARFDIDVIPHMVKTNEGTFKDGTEIDTIGVLKYMEDSSRHVLPIAASAEDLESFFAKQLATSNNVVHISLSEKIENSGCAIAKEAAKAFDNVFVFDSTHLSSAQGLLAIEACRLADEGKSPEEIIEQLEKVKDKVHTSFIVDSLEFLSRTGQVSRRTAGLIKSLWARPVLVLKKGKMTVGKFYFGTRENAWKKYINSIFSHSSKIDDRILFITYVGLTKKDQDWIRAQIDRKMQFTEIYFRQASPAIAANCGAGTFGILWREKDKKENWA
ncbi:MAG: DegV family EDD domain-containing protein [Saccharofermentans sp.]|nr:DegV family EDD domain-containing protein [Saccharofermentans sp.]